MMAFFRFILVSFFIITWNICFSQNVLEQPIDLDFNQTPLEEVLKDIESKLPIYFAYNSRLLPYQSPVSIQVNQEDLKTILPQLLSPLGIEYKAFGQQISLIKTTWQSFTISGFVRDQTNGEALIGADVFDPITFTGTSTNEYGFFSLTIPEGSFQLVCSYIGYEDWTDTLELRQEKSLSILLKPGNNLVEIVVVADSIPSIENSIGSIPAIKRSGTDALPLTKLDGLPYVLGESDLFQIAKLFPGIQSGNDASGGIFVRGSGQGENLVLLDGVPMYNVSHLFGTLSVFHESAIRSVNIQKSGFSARYGGRLSSVMDVRLKEGNPDKIHGELSFGLMTAGLQLNGPLVKDKISFLVSARKTTADLILFPLVNLFNSPFRFNYGFYDLNSRINFKLSDKSQLYFSTYFGNDKLFQRSGNFFTGFGFPVQTNKLSWGNKLVSLRWNHQLSNKMFLNVTGFLSQYQNRIDNLYRAGGTTSTQGIDVETNSFVQNYGFKADVDINAGPKSHIRFGMETTYQIYSPYDRNVFETTNAGVRVLNNSSLGELQFPNYLNAIYLEDNINVSTKLKMLLGFRIESTISSSRGVFISPQPRFSLFYNPKPKHQIEFNYDRVSQFAHWLSNRSFSLSSLVWFPASGNIKPSHAQHVSLGYAFSPKKNWSIKAESYLKFLRNLTQFPSGNSFAGLKEDWIEDLVQGKGINYGGEIFIEKTKGKSKGWLSYSLAWSKRKFDAINDGEAFYFRHDRRHEINFFFNHQFSPKFNIGLVGVLASGNPITLSNEYFMSLDGSESGVTSPGNPFPNLNPQFNYEDINNTRLPTYHRVDVSFNFTKQKKRVVRNVGIGIYNIYGRRNADAIVPRRFTTNIYEKLTLFPIPIPYFNWKVKF